MDFSNVQPDEVCFFGEIHNSERSRIYLVEVRHRKCIMRVYHDIRLIGFTSDVVELDIFKNESKALRRLNERGLGKQGIVPEFYGSIEKLNPAEWEPWLSLFARDEHLPSAVFMEYIPGMRVLDETIFTRARMNKFIEGINAMHRALVLHGDACPRNMMVVPGNPERLVWIDFELAQTIDEDCVTPRHESWFNIEERSVVAYGNLMEKSAAEQYGAPTQRLF